MLLKHTCDNKNTNKKRNVIVGHSFIVRRIIKTKKNKFFIDILKTGSPEVYNDDNIAEEKVGNILDKTDVL